MQKNLEADSKGMYAITLVDTGATFNVINEVCWEQLGCPELTPVDMVMIGVDRRPVQVLGATPELMITLGPTNEHRKLKAKFLVIRMKGTSSSIILGRTTISYYRMLIDLYNNRIYLPPDPDDETRTKGNGEEEHKDCLPPREECHVMDETEVKP